MSKYRNNYKYTLNKSLRQNHELLDQTYRRAMSKLGVDYSDKSTNRYDFNTSYRSSINFNNTERKKAFPVVPTYLEQSNNQANSSLYSQKSVFHKIEFDVKPSVNGTSNRYKYSSINNNSYLNTSPTYGSPNKPTAFFEGFQSRKDLYENIERNQKVSPEKRNYEYSPSKYTPSKYTPSKYTPILTGSPNQGSIEKYSPQPNILISSPERLRYLSLDERYQNQENNKKTPIQFNEISPSSNRNYLYLQKDAFNQDLRKKASLQSNQYSPSPTKYYNYKFSTISSKNKGNNQEPSQKHNNMNLKPNPSETTSQTVSKISKLDTVPTTNLKPASKNKFAEKDSKVSLELDSRNKLEIPAQTNKLPKVSNLPAKAPSPIQENKSPAFSSPTETNKHSSTTQMNTEKDATSLPTSSNDNLAKPTAPPPVSDMPNINGGQSLNPNNIESLKNQTEFLDQVEKSMKEDAKEDTNTILVERLKQYNKINSENTPTINNSSPIKSSPNKSSPSKLSPNKSSPNKSSPNKSSPNKSSPNKSSPNKSSPNKSSPNKSSPNKSSPNKSSSNNSFESPSSFKSTENNNNDSDFDTDIDIEISFEKSNSDFDVILYKEEEEYNEDEIIPNKTVRADSYQFPKMLDLICTQDFFIKPKIKFMIENTIDLADKMTSDTLKDILIHE